MLQPVQAVQQDYADLIIKEKSLELAKSTIEEVTLKSRRKKEFEDRERNIRNIVREMAKSMIEDNEEYIGKEIKEESIREIEKNKDKEETKEKKGV